MIGTLEFRRHQLSGGFIVGSWIDDTAPQGERALEAATEHLEWLAATYRRELARSTLAPLTLAIAMRVKLYGGTYRVDVMEAARLLDALGVTPIDPPNSWSAP